ncbi:malonyl-CoA:anthocyanidin 5-O-glucoside-6''-O-malonyltransferase-like [Momordica charantia]|uniref:Malonyl-CoA:anthocyanidin 5-O-glucoside-6''-O-malonyltransferase-like n=1 Tax=Momordica charantia TaxID=3673 RepID=A0A6J1D383_MOMCH|nr:malonyl-CoA:anthocyanidin 5-O-glucoside-6''-O-malonyltransferase-like [Momordica charantia]
MEQPKPSLKILELCKISPSPSPSPAADQFSLPLTFFDLPFFTSPPTERILFYSHPAADSILQKLKHSLSLTLSHFLPLAGNVVWPEDSPEPFILYKPGDSVSLTVAQADGADFHRLSSDQIRKANESHFLVPQFQAPDDTTCAAPILCLQITLFPGVGFSIGIATNHTVFDGKTSTTFLKSWASICTHESESESESNLPTLDFDRAAAKDPDGLQKLYLKYHQIFLSPPDTSGQRLRLAPKVAIPDDVAGGTFELTCADVEHLRATAAMSSSSTRRRRLSTFVLTYAHVSICIVRAQRLDPKTKVALFFPVDWRPRLGGRLVGENYFGNGIGGCGLFLEAKDFFGENRIGVISNQISEVIMEMEEKVKGSTEVVELMDHVFLQWFSKMPVDKRITVAGSPRFGLYDLDFGWGGCTKVEMTSMGLDGTFSMAESRNGNGGAEVGIVLPQDDMNLFSSLFFEGLKL